MASGMMGFFRSLMQIRGSVVNLLPVSLKIVGEIFAGGKSKGPEAVQLRVQA